MKKLLLISTICLISSVTQAQEKFDINSLLNKVSLGGAKTTESKTTLKNGNIEVVETKVYDKALYIKKLEGSIKANEARKIQLDAKIAADKALLDKAK